jgi:hypothetical protein
LPSGTGRSSPKGGRRRPESAFRWDPIGSNSRGKDGQRSRTLAHLAEGYLRPQAKTQPPTPAPADGRIAGGPGLEGGSRGAPGGNRGLDRVIRKGGSRTAEEIIWHGEKSNLIYSYRHALHKQRPRLATPRPAAPRPSRAATFQNNFARKVQAHLQCPRFVPPRPTLPAKAPDLSMDDAASRTACCRRHPARLPLDASSPCRISPSPLHPPLCPFSRTVAGTGLPATAVMRTHSTPQVPRLMRTAALMIVAPFPANSHQPQYCCPDLLHVICSL